MWWIVAFACMAALVFWLSCRLYDDAAGEK